MNQRAILSAGLSALGIELPPGTDDKLLAYLDLLFKWNRTYNLTALRDPEQAVTHHLLDSLAVLPWIEGQSLLDVGSGGGLPGIPLVIARPELRVTLVDAVQKKASFLQQASIELELPNLQAVHARVEDLPGSYSQITARAFAELRELVALTRHVLAPDGRWLAMKGVFPEQELSRLPPDVCVDAVHPLAVPGLDAERHLIIMTMKAGV